MNRLKKLMILAPMFIMMLMMTACGRSKYSTSGSAFMDFMFNPVFMIFGWPIITVVIIVIIVCAVKASVSSAQYRSEEKEIKEILRKREEYKEEQREYERLGKFAEELNKANVREEGISLLDMNALKADSKAELKIVKLLESLGLVANTQVTDEELVDKAPLRFDVVTQVNDEILVFEYDGPHHTQADMHKNRKSYETQKKHDKMKNDFCLKKGYHLYRIPYTDTEYLKDIEKIVKNAKKGKFDHKLKVKA